MTTDEMLNVLRAIRSEAVKNKPNPDKIFDMANAAINQHVADTRPGIKERA